MLIGPEPTTDRFEIVSYGKEDGKVEIYKYLKQIIFVNNLRSNNSYFSIKETES